MTVARPIPVGDRSAEIDGGTAGDRRHWWALPLGGGLAPSLHPLKGRVLITHLD